MTKFDDTIMAGENLSEAEISMGRMDANSQFSDRAKHCDIPKLKRLQINDQYLALDELFKTLNQVAGITVLPKSTSAACTAYDAAFRTLCIYRGKSSRASSEDLY